MIIAHGTWLSTTNRFFVWGETEPHEETSASNGAHPHQLAREDVEQKLLRALADEDTSFESEPDDITFLLPSENGFPIPSPEIFFHRDSPSPLEKRLRAWQVRGLSLSPEAALAWLAMLPASPNSPASPALDDGLPHRLRLGADLRFWSATARFALELLARQRFLPAIVGDGEKSMARWEPLVEEELDRIDALKAAMPPVCRAASSDETPSAHVLLEGFLIAVVDCFVRKAASRLRLRQRFVETDGEQFASSLLEDDITFDGDTAETLRDELASWKAQFDDDEASPFRIAFRLEPPPEPDNEEDVRDDTGSWELRFFLQALDDESLLVPLARVWEHGGTSWRYLERRLERPHEMVLEALGRAAALFAPIEESLKESRPESCSLDLDQAYAFLQEGAFLLRESGYGVLVPTWWGKREHGVGLSLRVAPGSHGPRERREPSRPRSARRVRLASRAWRRELEPRGVSRARRHEKASCSRARSMDRAIAHESSGNPRRDAVASKDSGADPWRCPSAQARPPRRPAASGDGLEGHWLGRGASLAAFGWRSSS